MKTIYRKLVRDNIPEICFSNNQTPEYKVLDDKDYKSALKSKRFYIRSFIYYRLHALSHVLLTCIRTTNVSLEKYKSKAACLKQSSARHLRERSAVRLTERAAILHLRKATSVIGISPLRQKLTTYGLILLQLVIFSCLN